MNHDQMIAVIQAHKGGASIEMQASGPLNAPWFNCGPGKIDFNFSRYSYRVKPEPREIWVNIYPNGPLNGPYVHPTFESAIEGKSRDGVVLPGIITIKVREVIE